MSFLSLLYHPLSIFPVEQSKMFFSYFSGEKNEGKGKEQNSNSQSLILFSVPYTLKVNNNECSIDERFQKNSPS